MTHRPLRAPLYDPAFEHDACGVGFVADAGGRSQARVLPLALAGLAALGHRGAFAADGESSDGAGVSLPLEPAVRLRIGAETGEAVLQLFLPRGRVRRERARGLVERALEIEGLAARRWRAVPAEPAVIGRAARASRPAFAQALVPQVGESAPAFERSLLLARRRIEQAARVAGLSDLTAVSASARSIVYKGLVAGERLSELFPDLCAGLPVSYALFHQRYATNTQPVWRLAQPFRFVAHNGEINTVRGNREQVRGRAHDPDPNGLLAALRETGPLLSPDGSDSLSLDELLELLVAGGWDLATALLAAIPEAAALRHMPAPQVAALRRRTAGLLGPWDGPAAIVFADGRRVGALLDRNGLRPLAYSITRDRLVAAASEAGAIPLEAAEIVRRGRLGPGELLLVEPLQRRILDDAQAKAALLRRMPVHGAARSGHVDRAPATVDAVSIPPALRYLAGLDAERLRLDIRTMAIDGHEPLWSMGDDTPTPGRGRIDRRAADHLKQAFAQVTNPAIDPERERVVMDLRVELGRRPALLAGPPREPRTTRLERPIVGDLAGLLELLESSRDGRRRRQGLVRLDATWPASAGTSGLEAALERLARDAVRAAAGRAEVLVVTDRALSLEQLPIPSVLAAGAVHTALTDAGLRGRADILLEAADILDPHSLAMALGAGATAIHPWLALVLAAEIAGGRGAEALTVDGAVENLIGAFDAGLRKTLARMGISAVASYIGGAQFESIELAPDVLARCFPAAAAWPGRVGFGALAARQLRRRDAARAMATMASSAATDREPRLPDPGLARFRGDGERHLFAPRIVSQIQALASIVDTSPAAIEAALDDYRRGLERDAALIRDGFTIRSRPAATRVEVMEVEPAEAIVRRFVVSAMSVGALSPEAHQALTIGIQRAGGAANTGEGGEDPAWYATSPGESRRDARIKQVASARFGVTPAYLARAEQLEIKIAQGSKPGEGGQLPARKATAYIAALRRGQPGQGYISPPPHHDIYSIEDLAQLIADLRAINPAARIGVKLVATRGVGTIAAGVAKAGADYVHLAGNAGGTGASPLSSIKHAGVPWELGLAEVHQVLLRQGLRDRVALRTDGGLQTGRDLLIAALLGAEEFAFGTSALVALGCDMARQCHLDTCPTGIATQREDLRAKFSGTPEQVERFFHGLAEDLRAELASIGARTVGEIVGESSPVLRPRHDRNATFELQPIIAAGRWSAARERRADPSAAARIVRRTPASGLEERLVAALRGQGSIGLAGLGISTAERSFGAALSGSVERGELRTPLRLELRGAAGQSFGAFLGAGIHLRLVGQANDYVAKGLGGGRVDVLPEPDLGGGPSTSVAGNTCLYGATAGRLHVVGSAGMRFAVRNAGAEAVVEGIGAHGAEYMTGGTLVVLGRVGGNLGAGMTGGRIFLHDPDGRHVTSVDAASVRSAALAHVAKSREDGPDRVHELLQLVQAHRDAGSELAARLLADPPALIEATWLVEPIRASAAPALTESPATSAPSAVRIRSAVSPQRPRSTPTR